MKSVVVNTFQIAIACLIFSVAEADLQIFGSSGNGFGTVSSDLDLCLVLPGADAVSALCARF